jgi:hypothetical protein
MTWLASFTRRKSKVVNNLTISDYQMKLIVHQSGLGPDTSTDIYLGGHCRDDFGDIRFTGPDQTTLLNYWIESIVSGAATVWIKIPTLTPTNNIYIYYDNPIATSLSNGTSTFDLFDNFDDLSQWTITKAGTSNATVSGGILDIYRDGANNIGLYRDIILPNKFLYEIRVQPQNFNSNKTWFYWNAKSYGTTINFWYERSGYMSAPRTVGGQGLGVTRLGTPTYGIWHTNQVIVDTTGVNVTYSYYEDGVLISSTLTTTKDWPGTINGLYLNVSDYDGVGHMYVDYILVRKYVSPEPTFGISGTEELNVGCLVPVCSFVVT